MKNIILKDGNFLIQYNEKYYVVNSFTKILLEAFSYTNEINSLSQILGISSRKTKQIFKMLDKKLINCPFYEKNLFLDEPIKLQWKITARCNLKCKHCYLGELPDQELSPNALMKIAERIVDTQIMELTITGGEALTVKCLPQILEKILSKNIKVHIFTNGVLLDKFIKNIDNFANPRLLSFEVSVDGLKKTHDYIRGKGTFQKTIKGIKSAIAAGYSVSTNTVLSKLNYQEIPKLFSVLKKRNISFIQISNIIDSGRATSSMKLSEEEHTIVLKNLKRTLKSIGGADKLLYANQGRTFMFQSENSKDIPLGGEKWKCGAGIGRATIDYKGNVYCCPFWEKSCLGNILKEPLSTIWKSDNKYFFLKELAKLNSGKRICIVAQDRVCND